MLLEATTAFWTTESLEVWNAFTYGGVTMSQYPLEIYRPWFRRFFIFVIPLGCINYLPGVAILGRPDPLGTSFRCSGRHLSWDRCSFCFACRSGGLECGTISRLGANISSSPHSAIEQLEVRPHCRAT